MSTARDHAEWLSLVEVSGPFLSLPVLLRVFPQGLDAHDAEHARSLRMAYGEWQEDQAGPKPSAAIHDAWISFVLKETLGLDERVLVEGQAVPQSLQVAVPEHVETLRPDRIMRNPKGDEKEGKERLLIQVYPSDQDLRKPVRGRSWKAWPESRMTDLLHGTGVRLGLVTNGEQWMLVDAPKGETTGFASWYAHLWFEEPSTLRAFRSLLGLRRFFGVAEKDTPEAMLAESATNQQDVTDQLGDQVRKAVEVLIRSLDRADQDHGRKLLADVPPEKLYEAALTVMMRLVFLFSAEEKGLLRLGDPLYDQHYAVSTLRAQLEDSSKFGEEVLERRLDAWCRLLSTFRAVYSGIDHERLSLPAYGGHLFDPDRFPFLEGRAEGTSWKSVPDPANPPVPLPVDNRTVLHLLNALQVLTMKVAGGGTAARKLSFRALEVTQIGHVYEGLLDHTAKRAAQTMLGLFGSKDQEPEIPLAELERLREKGEDELVKALKEMTGRSPSALHKALSGTIDGLDADRLRAACSNDEDLFRRVRPFASLLRPDTFGYPVVIRRGSVFMTEGTDRRSSGTHYTPRSLTGPIVKYTLEPLVYQGPTEGWPESDWELRSARHLLSLKVCDVACGSGAFLVEADNYLAQRLMEAWEKLEAPFQGRDRSKDSEPPTVRITPYGDLSLGDSSEQPIPLDPNEREVFARRIVAQRCLYGVDKNRLAAEMAKLSLWLYTMAKDKPFTFLDHAIRHGDSLVGVNADQLKSFSLDGQGAGITLPGLLDMIPKIISITRQQRQQLERLGNDSIGEVEAKERLFYHIKQDTRRLTYAADRLLAASWKPAKPAERMAWLKEVLKEVNDRIRDVAPETLEAEGRAYREEVGCPQPFHWALEFPEVFLKLPDRDGIDRNGFDACIGNPPFMGGQKITGYLGTAYRDYLVRELAGGKRGSADLCAYFFLRAAKLIRPGAGFGLIATNTIAQGDTREVGLDLLLAAEYVVNRAGSSQPWPGLASLEVSIVWVRRGGWNGIYVIDEKPTLGVTAFLTEPGIISGPPHRLAANAGKSFIGSYVLGMGFVLEPDEARRLIERDHRNKDVLFPYLNGEDLNSRPDQSPSRWVINFFDWPLDRDSAPENYQGPVSADYPDCLAIVEDKVKPERTRRNEKGDYSLRKPLPQQWWIYAEKRPALYRTITGMGQVLVRARIANRHSIVWVPAGWVYNEKTVIFVGCPFGIMQSDIHEVWARNYSSTLRTDMQYTPSDCCDTFPFPDGHHTHLTTLAETYHAHRHQIMLTRQKGLTKTYNHFHDSDETAADIQRLRDLHVEMDRAVAAAYGWDDLDLGHGFHETKQGVRFTLSEPARREVLARLLRLNHERYAGEVAQGLHDKKVKPASKKKSNEPTMFD
ncbi:Eco57I restriction-modification methylase domain-containing protein [Tundrisphaera sp. TA3]|uniref:Eco57I restriction-modification methylase domain-containing protein n=1 Tax=Tundrisphaera sp. TA3 TaxID=3435775 RepID=UPI003EBBBFBD